MLCLKDVKRLIFVAAPGIYDELPAKFNEFNKSQFGDKLTKYRKAADIIEASTLDYTIIRPAWLTFKMRQITKLHRRILNLEERKFQDAVLQV